MVLNLEGVTVDQDKKPKNGMRCEKQKKKVSVREIIRQVNVGETCSTRKKSKSQGRQREVWNRQHCNEEWVF